MLTIKRELLAFHLRRLRIEKGLSIRYLARKISISKECYFQLETGYYYPCTIERDWLLDIYGIELEDLQKEIKEHELPDDDWIALKTIKRNIKILEKKERVFNYN